MNVWRKITFCGVVFLTAVSLLAQSPAVRARIDVSSDGKFKLTPGEKPDGGMINKANWLRDKQDTYIFARGAVLTGDEWSTFEFSFIPESDGEVIISLRGPFHREEGSARNTPIWVIWSDISAEGAEIVNGDFSQRESNGTLTGWTLRNISESIVEVDGKRCLRVWHDVNAAQRIRVSRDREVIIRGRVRNAD